MRRMHIMTFLACCSCFSLFADSPVSSSTPISSSVPAAKAPEPCSSPAPKPPEPCPAPAVKEPDPCFKIKEVVPPCYKGGFTLGITTMTTFFNDYYFLTFGYFDDFFTFDFGVSYECVDFDPPTTNFLLLETHLGLRERLYQNLFFTYGVVGSCSVVASNLGSPNPYSIGCFTGFDFQAIRHWLFSAKIHPFNYAKSNDDTTMYRVFMSGSLSASYVF